MNTQETPTPRTEEHLSSQTNKLFARADFCRQLEVELSSITGQLEASQAREMALRKALLDVVKDGRSSFDVMKAVNSALSQPAPPVVAAEDAERLADALENMATKHGSHTKESREAHDAYRAKHPKP